MKQIFQIDGAPSPIGPYSQAVEKNGTLFISGQIPLDPFSGALVSGSIEKETHQVMKNLQSLLSAASYSWTDVMKCSIFLKDLNDFEAVNKVYASYFDDNFPARECVEVSKLPKDVNVEISLIAIK
jgi:2-iminobutanoate/2-iminopropanoate deaminase